jgi:peptidoglycan/xylan/chitin deacetylase (PgdA/CDA1 family)
MKKVLFGLLYRLGVTRFVAWWNRGRVVVLCYHGVTARPSRRPDDPKGLHVNRDRFAAHLAFLKRHYNLISLSEYLSARESGHQLPNYSAVLTFDDGFRNFLTVAVPLLTERKIPATVFLITDNAGGENGCKRGLKWAPEDDQRYLSWTEARTLKEEHGFEFGSHTCSHSRLLTLSPDETERELLHSFNDLVANLAVDKPTLSYPKGEYSQLLAADAQKLGYACAVTTDRGNNEMDCDLFMLGRTLIGDNDDLASLAVRVSGLREWLVSISSLLRWPRPAKPPLVKAVAAAVAPGLELLD